MPRKMYNKYSPELSPVTRSRYQNVNNEEPPVNIGLNTLKMDQTAATFKIIMGTEYVLYVKLQNFHWNVTGMNFKGIHSLLEEQYIKLGKYIDKIAEHIRKYGEPAPGSMQEFLKLNNKVQGVEEVQGALPGQVVIINEVLNSHESVARYIHSVDSNALNLGAQELLGKLYNYHTKAAWMWRAHLM